MNPMLLIFDLDGTLVDTRKDLTTAVNIMRTHYGFPNLSIGEVTHMVGDGITKLVTRAIPDTNIDQEEAVTRFNEAYRIHLIDSTHSYSGVVKLLGKLQKYKKAILTNKPYEFTKPICDKLHLSSYFDMIVGGDTLPEKKPSPAGINYIVSTLKISLDKTLMIGDGKNDIVASRKAGIPVVFAAYGYSDPEDILSLKPDEVIYYPEELLKILNDL